MTTKSIPLVLALVTGCIKQPETTHPNSTVTNGTVTDAINLTEELIGDWRTRDSDTVRTFDSSAKLTLHEGDSVRELVYAAVSSDNASRTLIIKVSVPGASGNHQKLVFEEDFNTIQSTVTLGGPDGEYGLPETWSRLH